jgi:hypothetical protein
VLLVLEGTGLERQQFFGYSGWVVPSAERQPGRNNLTGIEVKMTSPTTAEATVTDWEGMAAASGHQARLERKHGRFCRSTSDRRRACRCQGRSRTRCR